MFILSIKNGQKRRFSAKRDLDAIALRLKEYTGSVHRAWLIRLNSLNAIIPPETMLPSLFFSDQPEKTYAARLPWTQRKRLGQVFTPYEIAKFMAQWVTCRQFPAAVLDPALGLGIFLRALLEANPDEP